MLRYKILILFVLGWVAYILSMESSPLYFNSPKEAVEIITGLLKEKKWRELSRYYDLENSGIKLNELESGYFFYRKIVKEPGHPAGFSNYKEPFAPGFKYAGERVESKGDGFEIINVRMMIRIDEGDGMYLVGRDCFRMKRSSPGYRLLPGKCRP